MKLIFLGTNGWYDTATGSMPCIFLETEKYNIIFDAGFGFAKADKYLNKNKPTFLFISHFHLDHICGLHTLPKFRFQKALTIFAPTGAVKIFEIFTNHPFTASIRELSFKVKIVELKAGEYHKPFDFSCMKLSHADLTFGYRLEVDDKIITYCTDTGICENDLILARNCDVLIHECTLLPGQKQAWGHVNPTDAAMLAKKAQAKKLFLTHFDSRLYTNKELRKKSEKLAREIFPNTIAASDGLTTKL